LGLVGWLVDREGRRKSSGLAYYRMWPVQRKGSNLYVHRDQGYKPLEPTGEYIRADTLAFEFIEKWERHYYIPTVLLESGSVVTISRSQLLMDLLEGS